MLGKITKLGESRPGSQAQDIKPLQSGAGNLDLKIDLSGIDHEPGVEDVDKEKSEDGNNTP